MINLVTGERFDRTNYVYKLNELMNREYGFKLRSSNHKDLNVIYRKLKEMK